MSRRAISSSAKAESTDTRRGLPVASGKAVRIEAQPVRSRPDLATTRTEFIEFLWVSLIGLEIDIGCTAIIALCASMMANRHWIWAFMRYRLVHPRQL